MRVLMVAERLPPDIGGVERHISGLSKELSDNGIGLTLVAPESDSSLPFSYQQNGAEILRIPRSTSSSRDYLASWKWWQANRSLLKGIDLVHFHDVYSLLHWFGPAVLLAPGIPRYLTFHGYEMRYPIPKRARAYRLLAGRLVSASICVGHYLVKWFRVRPKSVTYGAVSLPGESPRPPGEPLAVFIGRLAPDTGLDIYLKGLGILRREHNLDIPILICGDGPSRSGLVELAQYERVRATFVGPVVDLKPYLNKASLIFTSGYLSMLEAMAHCRSVFAVFHTPVKSDYLNLMPGTENLFSISPTPEQLASDVVSYLSNGSETGGQLEAAFKYASGQTWSKLAQQYLNLWDQG